MLDAIPWSCSQTKHTPRRAGSAGLSPSCVSKCSLAFVLLAVALVFRRGTGDRETAELIAQVKWLRAHYPNLDIQIDGGINDKTAPLAIEAGANVLVAGSYVLKSDDPAAAAKSLRP